VNREKETEKMAWVRKGREKIHRVEKKQDWHTSPPVALRGKDLPKEIVKKPER